MPAVLSKPSPPPPLWGTVHPTKIPFDLSTITSDMEHLIQNFPDAPNYSFLWWLKTIAYAVLLVVIAVVVGVISYFAGTAIFGGLGQLGRFGAAINTIVGYVFGTMDFFWRIFYRTFEFIMQWVPTVAQATNTRQISWKYFASSLFAYAFLTVIAEAKSVFDPIWDDSIFQKIYKVLSIPLNWLKNEAAKEGHLLEWVLIVLLVPVRMGLIVASLIIGCIAYPFIKLWEIFQKEGKEGLKQEKLFRNFLSKFDVVPSDYPQKACDPCKN